MRTAAAEIQSAGRRQQRRSSTPVAVQCKAEKNQSMRVPILSHEPPAYDGPIFFFLSFFILCGRRWQLASSRERSTVYE